MTDARIPIKRNTVVGRKGDEFVLYGRVIRMVGDDQVLWVDCGKHLNLNRINELEAFDYKGRWEWTNSDGKIKYYARTADRELDFSRIKYERDVRWIKMPSLRKLKQLASRYAGRNAWRTPLDYEFL